jgi:hypothetical protein
MPNNLCRNCGHNFTLQYCNNCGEKVFYEKDKSILHFFEEGFHFLTHLEGKFFTTIKTMFVRPGKVSLDYSNGVRKKYFKPVSLFLLLVVIYLLFPLTQGLNMKAVYHTGNLFYGNYDEAKIAAALRETGLNMAEFENVFHSKGEKVSRILLVILIPLTALWFWLLTYRKRPFYFDQLVFSAEVNCLYLLWGFLLLPLVLQILEYFFHIGYAGPGRGQLVLGLIIYIPILLFAAIGSYRFYKIKKWYAALFGILFLVVHTLIMQIIYKFILFVITIHLIH